MKLTKLSLQIGIVLGVLSILYTAFDFIPKIIPRAELQVDIQYNYVSAPYYLGKSAEESFEQQQKRIPILNQYLKDSITTTDFLGHKIYNPLDSVYIGLRRLFIDSIVEEFVSKPYYQVEVEIYNKTKKEIQNVVIDLNCEYCSGYYNLGDSLYKLNKGIIRVGNIGAKKSITSRFFITSATTITSSGINQNNRPGGSGIITYTDGSIDLPDVVYLKTSSTWENFLLDFLNNTTFRIIVYIIFLIGIYYLLFKLYPVAEKKVKEAIKKLRKRPESNSD